MQKIGFPMSKILEDQVSHEEVSRDYRTEIPNIVFEMNEAGLISDSDFKLYCTYRRIAGQNGGCYYGTRSLVKKCGLSHTTITLCKKNLSQKFEILGWKSLIKITPCDRKKETADLIRITDIWPDNFKFFKNKLTCANSRHTGVPIQDTRVCKIKTQKKKRNLKKELHEERTESESEGTPQQTHHKPIMIPILLHRNGNEDSDYEKDDCILSQSTKDMMDLIESVEPYFSAAMIAAWMNKWGSDPVRDTLRFFMKTVKIQKVPIRKPEAWMEDALKRNFSLKDQNAIANKAFAQKVKKQYNLGRLKINKNYCADTGTTCKDWLYAMSPPIFQESLMSWIHCIEETKVVEK
jgi:hypothetical protein